MSLRVPRRAAAREAARVPAVDAQTAQGLADDYLTDYIGDLLEAGPPQLCESRWVIPVILGNSRRGRVGEVGTIAVDAETGAVLFSEEDREKVKTGARLLVGTPRR